MFPISDQRNVTDNEGNLVSSAAQAVQIKPNLKPRLVFLFEFVAGELIAGILFLDFVSDFFHDGGEMRKLALGKRKAESVDEEMCGQTELAKSSAFQLVVKVAVSQHHSMSFSAA